MKEKMFKLVEICKDKKVWIQTHNFPDPDAISSAFGLGYLLSKYGIETSICYAGSLDKLSAAKMCRLCDIEISSLDEIKDKQDPEDVILLVDCQFEGGNVTDFVGKEQAVIDHHPIVNDYKYEYEDRRITGACASIITSYFKELGVEMPVNVATALMYGFKTDTLQLSRGVTEFDLEMFTYLFTKADKEILRQLETNTMEYEDLRAYGTAIQNVLSFGKVGLSFVDFQCSDTLVSMISDFILSLEEVEVAVVWAKRNNGLKFSIRSERSAVDAGKLASTALKDWGNGGGHANMAGGFAPVSAFNSFDNENVINHIITERFIETIKELYPGILD